LSGLELVRDFVGVMNISLHALSTSLFTWASMLLGLRKVRAISHLEMNLRHVLRGSPMQWWGKEKTFAIARKISYDLFKLYGT
jgi:hypothetical protein